MHEYERIGKLMDKYEKEGNLDERNKLVPKWRKAFLSHDFGLKEGQGVEYWDNKWKKGKIDKIESNLRIYIGGVIVYAELIRKIKNEQLSLDI